MKKKWLIDKLDLKGFHIRFLRVLILNPIQILISIKRQERIELCKEILNRKF